MKTNEIETTRRCSRAHSGPRNLDAVSNRGRLFECRGCRQFYNRSEAVDAKSRFPTAGPGVESVGSE